jgi:hypothetical protein
MKYLFIDTNAFIVSCISTRSEHKVESFNVLKHRLRKKEVKLLIPEVVRVEFERKIGELHNIIKLAIGDLEEIVKKAKVYSLPILEEEKRKLTDVLKEISEEKEKRFASVLEEIRELFLYENVESIPLSGEIFSKAYMRCQRREKPFKARDSAMLHNSMDGVFERSIMNDALIIESLAGVCVKLSKTKDVLIFCSENTADFAAYDEKLKKHVVHGDISKDLNVSVKYYRFLPEMMRIEFKKEVVKERKDEELTLADLLEGKSEPFVLRPLITRSSSPTVLDAFQHIENEKRRLMEVSASAIPSSVLETYQRLEDEKRRLTEMSTSAIPSSVLETYQRLEDEKRRLMEMSASAIPSSVLETYQRLEDEKRRLMEMSASVIPSSVLETYQRLEDERRRLMEMSASAIPRSIFDSYKGLVEEQGGRIEEKEEKEHGCDKVNGEDK